MNAEYMEARGGGGRITEDMEVRSGGGR